MLCALCDAAATPRTAHSPTPSPACTMGPYHARHPPSANAPPSNLPVDTKWSFSNTAPMCKAIVENPKPMSHTCKRDMSTLRCADGSFQMFSQMSQDYYLFRNHFSRMKRRGIYLDIAANHPFALSNTYFLDKCLGWTGICVEAHPKLLANLYRQRTCAVVPTCVSDHDGASVNFILHGGTSGVDKTNKNMNAWKERRTSLSSIHMVCTTMALALQTHDVSTVDYLSLDVEGHELAVLKGFDWNRVKVNVMTIECQPDTLPAIAHFLNARGYVRHYPRMDERACRSGKLIEDVVFLHSAVIFGNPE